MIGSWNIPLFWFGRWFSFSSGTVDGRNPAPADVVDMPVFIGFYTSQVVQDFFHQQYSQLNHGTTFPGVGSLSRYLQHVFLHPKGGCLGFLNQATASFFLCGLVWMEKHSAKIGNFPGKKQVLLELASMMEYDGKWLHVGFVFNRNVSSSFKHMENDGKRPTCQGNAPLGGRAIFRWNMIEERAAANRSI